MAVGAAFIAAAVLKAGGAVAPEVGNAVAARKSVGDAERKEAAELRALKDKGELGLTPEQQATVDQRFLAERAAMSRDTEARQLQAAAAQGLGGAVSGRDIFLREQAATQGQQAALAEQNVLRTNLDEQARANQEAQLAATEQQIALAEAERTRAIGAAVGAGLTSLGGSVGGMADRSAAADSQAQAQQFQLQLAQAEAGKATNEELVLELDSNQPTGGTGGGGTSTSNYESRAGSYGDL